MEKSHRRFHVVCVFLLLQILTNCRGEEQFKQKPPNIVVFLADDLGIGDIGCFGNTTVPTPNIDRLCKEGVKFTHLIAAASVCTPSRAAFLTGRYPLRTGLTQNHSSPPVIIFTSSKSGLHPDEYTWAKLLQDRGYATAATGKWHLGWDRDHYGDLKHSPMHHGFDSFYGIPSSLMRQFDMETSFWTYNYLFQRDQNPINNSITPFVMSFIVLLAVYSKNLGYLIFGLIIALFMISWFFLEHFAIHKTKWWDSSPYMIKFLNSMLFKEGEVIEQPIRLSTLAKKLTDSSINFLRNQSKQTGGAPFALFHSFSNVHTPLVVDKEFQGKSKEHGHYGDSIIEMDAQIGRILDVLDQTDQTENTIVYFTSDHGSHIDLGTLGGSNRPFNGGKGMETSEGGIRVPGVMKWPKVITPASVIEVPLSLMDFFPTVADIVLGQNTTPQSPNKIDGVSFLPLLQGKEYATLRKFIRHYCGTSLQALRYIGKDGKVFKGYMKRLVTNDDGHCGSDVICSCFEDSNKFESFSFEEGDIPIYDIVDDPREESPLDNTTALYSEVLHQMKTEYDAAMGETLPPSQFSNPWNVMPRPFLQPCARFPRCSTP